MRRGTLDRHKQGEGGLRGWDRPLLAVCFVAVLLRLAAAVWMGDRVDPLPAIFDQVSYHTLALRLLDGHGYSFAQDWYPFTAAGAPTAHWSFLYPGYLAAVYAFVGVHPLAARFLQSVASGLMLCGLGYWIGARLFGRRAGLAAAAALAVYPLFVYYGAALMTEAFYLCAVLGVLALMLRLADRPDMRTSLALGLTIGFAALLRQAVLLPVPALLAWLLWRRRGAVPLRSLLMVGVGAGALIAPWSARNLIVFERPLVLNSNAGYALFVANHPKHGVEYDWSFVPPVPEHLAGLDESQIDHALLTEGLAAVATDPWRVLRLSVSRVDDYFIFWPTIRSPLSSDLARVFSLGAFLPFMIAGLWRSRGQWRDLMPLYIFGAIYSIAHILTWPGPRYRMPVDAVLLVFAGYALAETWTRVRAEVAARRPDPALAAR